jgi:hypothetical protein
MTLKTTLRIMETVLLFVWTLILLSTSLVAQSRDRDTPTRLTTAVVAGRVTQKGEAHYYSFIGGPGEVKVLLDIAADDASTIIYAEVSDVDGRVVQDSEKSWPYIGADAGMDSKRFVGRYEVRRRQMLVLKVWYGSSFSDGAGHYKVRLEGAVAFDQEGAFDNNSAAPKDTKSTDASCLPKSGILHIVMADGTVQEINLARAKEVSIRP